MTLALAEKINNLLECPGANVVSRRRYVADMCSHFQLGRGCHQIACEPQVLDLSSAPPDRHGRVRPTLPFKPDNHPHPTIYWRVASTQQQPVHEI
jgi:hypothetical protein